MEINAQILAVVVVVWRKCAIHNAQRIENERFANFMLAACVDEDTIMSC
jgi:hypothetical protein